MEAPRDEALLVLELMPAEVVVEPEVFCKASSSPAAVESVMLRSTINTSIKTCCGNRSSFLIRASMAG